MKAQALTAEQRVARIVALAATPDALIASDSGTHGRPDDWSIYETIVGDTYAVYRFGGGQMPGPHTAADAKSRTPGRMRKFPDSLRAIRAKARELAELRASL